LPKSSVIVQQAAVISRAATAQEPLAEFQKARLLICPTMPGISPARPESAGTPSSPTDPPCLKQGLTAQCRL